MSERQTRDHAEKPKQGKGATPNTDPSPVAGGELHQIAGGAHTALITNQGVALSDNQTSLNISNVRQDAGVVDAHDRDAFIAAAKTRQLERKNGGSNIHMNATASLLLVAIAGALSGCPLTVNLNVSADKPIPVYLIVDRPVEMKLDADLAVTKVPPIHVDGDVGVNKFPPIRLGP